MYISKIELNNIRCFNKVVLNFEDVKGNCRGSIILGDNGIGKTTILRAIAMCLSGESSAAGLMDELDGEWIARGAEKGYIRLDLKLPNNGKTYYIEMSFGRESGDAVIIENYQIGPIEKDFPWEDIFVCGYGASRGVVGSENYSNYFVTDAVYTLFSPDAVLQNPELMLRRIKDIYQGNAFRKILIWIDTILMLNEGAIQLDMGGLVVTGPWGKSMPVGALADGHYATITMICDLLGFALLYDRKIFKKEILGIVMIDEIEQHLHPKWQRKVIALLRKVFPKIQFIITTHSPLVAGNAGKLFGDDLELKLFHVGYYNKIIEVSEIEESLGELDCDQILSSEAFGYISSINQQVENILREASILAGKDNKTLKEEEALKKIKGLLKDIMFPKGKTLIERITERDYYSDIEKKVDTFKKTLREGKND